MSLEKIWREADSRLGCLAHLRTTQSRRRHACDEDPLHFPNLFVSDEAKLLSSKAFRVMRDKTQVFSFPESPLIRNRQSHCVEVAAVAVVISEMLGLNTDLCRAAGLGHDIGHVPFGHQGEGWFSKTMSRAFRHEIMGVVTAQHVERCGRGLNLNWHTLEAIMCHGGGTAREGMSPEARVMRYADKFTYIFHDVNDVIVRQRYPVQKPILELIDYFGSRQRERVTTAIAGLVVESAECGKVCFEHSEPGKKFGELRSLMYQVYPKVTQQNVERTMGTVLEFLELLSLGDPFLLLALMTDRDVAMIAAEPMKDMQVFNRTSVCEIVPHLSEIGKVDLCDPDLDW